MGHPAAERCTALLLIARGDTDAAVVAAEHAADDSTRLDSRSIALAPSSLPAKRCAVRASEPAAERIGTAKEIFERLGAALWVERAETELRRASPRPRRDRELTSAERRVARRLRAEESRGGPRLFTTEATVEKHLTSVYRKLGIRSRTELARRVADGSLSLDDE